MSAPILAHTAPPRTPRRAPTLADLVLVGLVLLAIPLSWRAGRVTRLASRLVFVEADGQRRTLDADKDQTVALQGPLGITRLRVESGEVWIESAPCERQLCRRMGRLRGPGRSLVCVPNRIAVRFAAPGEEVDAIAR